MAKDDAQHLSLYCNHWNHQLEFLLSNDKVKKMVGVDKWKEAVDF